MAVVGTILPALVSAQEPAEGEAIEEIVVTGSRIARRDFDAPSPITTVDRATLLNSAQPTLENALNQLPQFTPDFGRSSNNPGDGKSRINLRGLGAGRTLVMLNGRRLAPAGVGSAVDVNTLPQVLMDRVEVITGGASTVYGSDAVAGVVNFITRGDFEGLGLETSAYVTGKGDSEVYDLNLTWGHNFASGRGNLTAFAGYLDRAASYAADREISAVPLLDTWTGEIVKGGSQDIPGGMIPFPLVNLGSGLVQVKFTPDGLPARFVYPDDLYNYAPANYLQVPLRRYSSGVFLNFDVSDRAEAYVELFHTRNEVRQNLAPVPAALLVTVNVDNPVLTPAARQVLSNFAPGPADPARVSFPFRRRMEEVGARIMEAENDYSRVLAGVRGPINDNWEYDAWASHTKGDETLQLKNDVSRARLLQGLLVDPATTRCFDESNGCVPLNVFGAGNLTGEAVDFLRVAPFSNLTSRDQSLVSGFVRGQPFDTWAGPMSIALGVEWRSDSGEFKADEALFLDDTLGYNGDSSVDGNEDVSELYAEALVPLAENARLARYLALEVGGRLSRYDNAGSVSTWKTGGEWEPATGLRFRTMFQRSVRAPNLVEAFQEQLRQEGTFVNQVETDPCSASRNPVGNGFADKCELQGIPADQIGSFEAAPFFPVDFISGGNSALAPETAETWTIGMVYSGFEKWSLSVDYFDLEVDDTIGAANAPTVCFNAKNVGDVLCDKIRRDPATFNVIEVDQTNSNLGALRTSGFDVQLNYSTELPARLALDRSYADFSLDVIWTHLRTLTFQESPAVDPVECAGYFGFTCQILEMGSSFPKDRVTANGRYGSGKVTAHLTWRWIGSTDNSAPHFARLVGFQNPVVSVPSTGPKNYFDAGLGYQLTDNISARLNIANLTDTDPPLMADAVFANNTDERMYDIFGRSYQLSFALNRAL